MRRENKNLWTLRECKMLGKGSSSHSDGGRKFVLDGTFNNNNNNNNNNNFIYIALKSNNCPKRYLITKKIYKKN